MFANKKYVALAWVLQPLALLLPAPANAEEVEAGVSAGEETSLVDLLSTDPATDETPPIYDNTIPVEPVADGTATPKTVPTRSHSRLIEEIVVTAQKREENLQDVPIAVAAFSGEKLDALGVKDARDLQLVTPGLVYSTNPVNYSIVYLRGIGNDAFIPSVDSSVATYVDGIYFPFNHGLASSFSDIERVEVLKGPQGTLFGRNTTGGAINIVTKKPVGEFNARLSQSFETFGRTTTKGSISGELTDNIAASLAALYDDGQTYYEPAPDSPVQEDPIKRDKAFSLKLLWTPTDTLSATLNGFKATSDVSLVNTQTDPKPVGTIIGVRSGKPYEYNSNLAGYLLTDNEVGSLTVEWKPDSFNTRLLTSYLEVHNETLYDYDASPSNGVYFLVPTEFVRATAVELQFLSKPGGAFTFDDRLEWTTGYYFYQSTGGYANVYFGVLDPDQPSTNYPITIAGILGGALDVLNALGITVQNNVELELNGVLDTTSHAVYAQSTWRPLDWFALTLGGRFQHEERGTVVARSGLSRRPAQPIPLFNFPLDSTTTDNFSPKVTFEFRPFSDDTMLYASAQRGFKSGTYNVVAIYTRPNYIEPEEVTALEVGLKGSLFDGALVYSAAIFDSTIKNLQTLNISLVSGGAVQLANAERASISGAEFDLTWQIMPALNPGLVVTASAAYLDGQYDDFQNASGFDEVSGLYFGRGELIPHAAVDFSGNETVRTPEFSGTLGVNQTLEVSGGSLELGVSSSLSSSYYFDTQNLNSNPSYALLNARISYLYEPWNLRATLLGQNLTEEEYFYDKLVNDFGTNAFYAPPLTYGLTLDWSY